MPAFPVGRDRLSEITQKYRDDFSILDIDEDIPAESQFVGTFYNQVSEIQRKLKMANDGTLELGKNYSSLIVITTGTDEYKEMKKKVDHIRNDTNKILFDIKNGLEKIRSDMRKVKMLSAEYRIRENQYMVLSQQFSDALENYNKCNSDFYDKEESNLKRQILVVNPSLSEEQVEKMIQEPEFDISSFMNQVLLNESKSTVSALYQSAKETRDDLLKLEASMEEVVQLFRDLNALIHHQSPILNNIELNTRRINVSFEAATKNLKQARKLKKKCIIS